MWRTNCPDWTWKKATGPENIPTWVLRDFGQVLAGPVACLWNSSIREGKISNVWKSAYVSPLPKVTPALEVRKDLRPISLTPLLPKGLESHVVKWLWEIIFDKIDPKQFGSVKGSSTVHALVEPLHNCYNSTDASRNFVWILLLDYSKAFDLINHQIVLQKLSDMGTPALLLRWIAAFLTARQQQVRIGGSQSSWYQLCGGAPQGTLLGVILFVVHINDLEFECQYSKYVDDTNIMRISSDPSSATLQNDADTAHTWSSQNDMIINATKTKELRIDFSKSRGPFTQLYIGNSAIEVVSQSKILGVIISDDLKWNQHVEYITGKGTQRLHLLVLCRRAGIPSNEMLLMYKTKIWPVLEYACRMASWPNPISNWWYWKGANSSNAHNFPRIIVWGCLGLFTVTLKDRRNDICLRFFKSMEKSDHKLHHLFPNSRTSRYSLRKLRKYESAQTKNNRAEGASVNWFLKHFSNSI